MEIFLAESAGFCFGVNRAIELVYGAIGKDKLYSFGPIIHNKTVNQDLQEKGVQIVDSLDDIEGGTVVIRSHGVEKKVYDEIEQKGMAYIDCTCPFVKKIHNIVAESSVEGKSIIVIGDPEHPEVMGITGWCKNGAVIIKDSKDIDWDRLPLDKEYSVVVQTTFMNQKFEEIISELSSHGINFKTYNTICSATSKRQEEAIELAQKMDKMIVIGDKKSSNTQKLYEICKKNCNNTFYIETIQDLVLNIFKSNDKIGITAGASTPPAIIKEVVVTMMEAATPNNEEQKIEEATFQQLLDQSFVSLHTGDVVKGTVLQISDEEVSVNLGYKSDGIIPKGEFNSDPSVLPSQTVAPGDEIEVFVVRVNDGEGNVLLSKKRLEAQKGMEDIQKAFEEKTSVAGKVTEIVKGGIIALVNGVRVFIPSSQVSNRYVEDLSVFKGQELKFNIIELDRSKRRIIGGRKALIEKESEEKKAALFSTLEIGQKIEGEVSRLTSFGAFVDLGGVDGLIHVSEMSWGRISSPKEVLSEGQKVSVVVLDVDKEKGKISLSLKDIKSNPWLTIEEKYAPGSVVSGKVVRMVPFGAFIELEPGVDGLMHISQIANKRVEKPEDELTIGETIEVKVLEVNPEQKKISLSRRALEEPVAEEASEAPLEASEQAVEE